jgi:RNA polymerase sigma-70 factor (ECF subfamily)
MAAGTLDGRALAKGPVASLGAANAPDLATVYEAHFRYVWRCLRTLGVRDGLLEDALQDVFIVVQKRLPGFDGQGELRTWLYAIALRVARKYRSRSGRESARRGEAPEGHEAAAQGDVECTAESNELLSIARRALDALDDEKREVFVLARVEQMSAPEIASVVGVPINTVYSRLRAARLAFEAEVQRLESSRRSSP